MKYILLTLLIPIGFAVTFPAFEYHSKIMMLISFVLIFIGALAFGKSLSLTQFTESDEEMSKRLKKTQKENELIIETIKNWRKAKQNQNHLRIRK